MPESAPEGTPPDDTTEGEDFSISREHVDLSTARMIARATSESAVEARTALADAEDDTIAPVTAGLREQVASIEARANAVPKGPWVIEGDYPQRITNAEALVIAECFEGPQWPPSIAEFIAHAREDVPLLCRALAPLLAAGDPGDLREPLDLAACRADIARAHTEVGDIAHDGYRRWRMSIPAQPNRDSDLLISAGLAHGERLADEVEQLRTALAERTARLAQAEARAEFAEGELSALRDHRARWETEKARADKAEAERDVLREHVLDIDAHATPYGDIPDEPGYVGTYLLTAGALHRALGKIGHSAPKCQAEAVVAGAKALAEQWIGNQDAGTIGDSIRADAGRQLLAHLRALDGADSPGDAERIADEKPTGVHAFEQNPAATQISVCICGLWRDHHVHGADPCGCDACRTPETAPDAPTEDYA